jgi:hypothetical protein
MATKAVEMMTEKLIKISEVFGRLDPQRIAEELQPSMKELLGQV